MRNTLVIQYVGHRRRNSIHCAKHGIRRVRVTMTKKTVSLRIALSFKMVSSFSSTNTNHALHTQLCTKAGNPMSFFYSHNFLLIRNILRSGSSIAGTNPHQEGESDTSLFFISSRWLSSKELSLNAKIERTIIATVSKSLQLFSSINSISWNHKRTNRNRW